MLISSRYSILYLLLILCISVFVSYLTYRKSSLSKITKSTLFVFRTLSLFLIISLLIEPVFTAFIDKIYEYKNIIIVDISRSNRLMGKEESKTQEIKNVLNKFYNAGNDVLFFTMPESSLTFTTNELKTRNALNPDSLIFDGHKTEPLEVINAVTNSVSNDNINSFTLITDGIFNSGPSPITAAIKLNIPFHTIGIGDTVQKQDLVLDKVIYNPKSFTGTQIKISAQITMHDLTENYFNVKLYREGHFITNKVIKHDGLQTKYKTEFFITEQEPAIVKYRVIIDAIPGEITAKNNYEDFFIEYIDNKVKLLYISGSPSYDNAFIISILKRTNNYEVITRVQKSGSEFYEGKIDENIYTNLSAVFLLGFPSSLTSSELSNNIFEKIRKQNIPIIYFSAINSDYSKLQPFQDLFPFNINQNIIQTGADNTIKLSFVSVKGDTAEEFFINPITNLENTNALYKNIKGIIQSSESTVKMIDKLSGEPILITRNTGTNNTSAFLAYGLWRWRLNPSQASMNFMRNAENLIISVVYNSIKKDKNEKIKIISKDYFDVNEKTIITAEVYDENGNITNAAKLSGNLTGLNLHSNYVLNFNIKENRYFQEFNKLPADDYVVNISAEMGGSYYSSVRKRILVDTSNLEYKVTKSNFENLRELSGNTGGIYKIYSKDESYSDILQRITKIQAPKKYDTDKMPLILNIWQSKYMLLLIILLMTTEWIMRKRNNLP